MQMRFGVVIAITILLAGCASYHAEPIDAPATAEHFHARTLDAGLAAASPGDATATRPATVPTTAWDLDRLTQVALVYHPDLEAARARAAEADAAIQTAGMRPNPTLSVSPQYSLNPGSGTPPWVVNVNLDIPFETFGKRGHRIAQARALSDSAQLAIGQTTWQVRSRLRAALVDVLLDQRTIAALQTQQSAQDKLIALIEARVKVGEASSVDLRVVRLDAIRSSLALRTQETRLAEDRSVLAQSLGVPTAALDGVTLDESFLTTLPPPDAIPPAQLQHDGLFNRTDLRRSLFDYAATEAALQLEIAKQYPDIHISPNYEYDQGQNKIGIGVAMDLPVLNQNQGPIAEAEARRREARATFLGLQAQVIGQIEQATARYRGALDEMARARELVENERTRTESIQRAFDAGNEDRVTLTTQQIEAATAALGEVDALRRAQIALGQLEDALERPLITESTTRPAMAEAHP